jgi:hypothetical protein
MSDGEREMLVETIGIAATNRIAYLQDDIKAILDHLGLTQRFGSGSKIETEKEAAKWQN